MKAFGLMVKQSTVKPAVIVDIDGTLANTDHRQHFLETEKKEWGKFFRACGEDDLHESVKLICNAIFAMTDVHVFLCTGRPSQYFLDTDEWLERMGICYSTIIMRDQNDTRPDVLVKREMLDFIRECGFDVKLSIDDRPEVVAMWRDNNVPCFQVDPVTWKRTPAMESKEKEPKAWLRQMSAIPGADPMYKRCLDKLIGLEDHLVKYSTF